MSRADRGAGSIHDFSPRQLRDRSQVHLREFRRRPADLPVGVSVFLPDGAYYDRGTARIVNISASGALLGDLQLEGRRLPLGEFLLTLIVRDGPQAGLVLQCRPVRVVADGLGVSLDDVSVAVGEREEEGG